MGLRHAVPSASLSTTAACCAATVVGSSRVKLSTRAVAEKRRYDRRRIVKRAVRGVVSQILNTDRALNHAQAVACEVSYSGRDEVAAYTRQARSTWVAVSHSLRSAPSPWGVPGLPGPRRAVRRTGKRRAPQLAVGTRVSCRRTPPADATCSLLRADARVPRRGDKRASLHVTKDFRRPMAD
jgi:hypothetical protein